MKKFITFTLALFALLAIAAPSQAFGLIGGLFQPRRNVQINNNFFNSPPVVVGSNFQRGFNQPAYFNSFSQQQRFPVVRVPVNYGYSVRRNFNYGLSAYSFPVQAAPVYGYAPQSFAAPQACPLQQQGFYPSQQAPSCPLSQGYAPQSLPASQTTVTTTTTTTYNLLR